MMDLLRRLAHTSTADGGGYDTGNSGHMGLDTLSGEPSAWGQLPLPTNVIHQHRDELRQLATGRLDHMVIDVVSSLFDQILSDPKVPPQMARLLARLQLSVLKIALQDAAFLSDREHPVRRFMNAIARAGSGWPACAASEAWARRPSTKARARSSTPTMAAPAEKSR